MTDVSGLKVKSSEPAPHPSKAGERGRSGTCVVPLPEGVRGGFCRSAGEF